MSLCPLTDLTLPWCRSIFGAGSPSTGLEDKRNAVGRMSVLTPCSVVILKDLPCRCCEVSSQVRSLTQFYFVGYSQPQIGVKKVASRFASSVFDLARNT